MNLLKETIEKLEEYEKSSKDILFVCNSESKTSWDNFVKIADFEYDDGYGGNEIGDKLKIVGEDFWLERHEYDGSEWWEFKTKPNGDLPEKEFTKEDILEE